MSVVSYMGNAKKCKVSVRVARIRSIDDRDYYLGGNKLDRVLMLRKTRGFWLTTLI